MARGDAEPIHKAPPLATFLFYQEPEPAPVGPHGFPEARALLSAWTGEARDLGRGSAGRGDEGPHGGQALSEVNSMAILALVFSIVVLSCRLP